MTAPQSFAEMNAQVARLSEALESTVVTEENRDGYFAMLQRWRDTISEFRELANALESKIAESITGQVELGGNTYRRSRSVSRTQWDNDALIRTVLDSQLVDPETGEIEPETPIQKLRHIWACTGSTARLGALRKRGIEPDRYCNADYGPARLAKVTKK